MRTIAIINQKGGCGKTTTAINLSAVLARNGKRVLLIDMDPQGHCAAGLGIPEQRIEADIGDAMLSIGSKPIDQARLLWRATRNLDLAPSRMKLAGLEAAKGGLADLPDRSRRLTAVIEKFRSDYDVCVIDCPPSIGLLTFNALAAADMVLIPVETGFFSLQGATRQVNTVRTLGKKLGVLFPIWLLPTLHDEGNSVAQDLLEELNRRFRERVVPIIVRRDSRLREAASFGQSIVDYAPGSTGSEDYGRLGVWAAENLQARQIAIVDGATHGEHVELTDGNEAAEGAASIGVGQAVQPAMAGAASSPANQEIKSVSRAEDVARRAQEFLRRIAMGKSPGEANKAGQHSTQPSHPAMPATTTAQYYQPQAAAPSASIARAPVSETIADVQQNAVQSQTVSLHAPRNVLAYVDDAPTPQGVAPASISPAAQRLLGVTETNQGILFVQPMHCGRTVSVAGTFNNWSPSAHVLKANPSLGVHELCLRLPRGKHTYRLVIDGHWTADPHNNAAEPNPFGEVNSVVYVGERAAVAV
ncbi:MAG: AAA family ATPase [Phycisphaerales bacterium]